MFLLSPQTKVFLAKASTDMRKSFRGLIVLAEAVLNQDPASGHLFVFVNKRRDMLKILHWDGSWLVDLVSPARTRHVSTAAAFDGRRGRHRVDAFSTVDDLGWNRSVIRSSAAAISPSCWHRQIKSFAFSSTIARPATYFMTWRAFLLATPSRGQEPSECRPDGAIFPRRWKHVISSYWNSTKRSMNSLPALPSSSVSCTAQNANASSPTRARMRLSPQRLLNPLGVAARADGHRRYRPILWHVMRYYAHFGHRDFILCLGYKADIIKDFFLQYEETLSDDFVLSGETARLICLRATSRTGGSRSSTPA